MRGGGSTAAPRAACSRDARRLAHPASRGPRRALALTAHLARSSSKLLAASSMSAASPPLRASAADSAAANWSLIRPPSSAACAWRSGSRRWLARGSGSGSGSGAGAGAGCSCLYDAPLPLDGATRPAGGAAARPLARHRENRSSTAACAALPLLEVHAARVTGAGCVRAARRADGRAACALGRGQGLLLAWAGRAARGRRTREQGAVGGSAVQSGATRAHAPEPGTRRCCPRSFWWFIGNQASHSDAWRLHKLPICARRSIRPAGAHHRAPRPLGDATLHFAAAGAPGIQ